MTPFVELGLQSIVTISKTLFGSADKRNTELFCKIVAKSPFPIIS